MLDEEEQWALNDSRTQLRDVRVVICELMARLQEPMLLPISSAHSEMAKGILHRQGAHVSASASIHAKRGSFSFEELKLDVGAIETVFSALAVADRSVAAITDGIITEAPGVLRNLQDAEAHLYTALNAMRSSNESHHPRFPDVVKTSPLLPPSACAEVIVDDFKLVMAVYLFQDVAAGNNQHGPQLKATETCEVSVPDPTLLAVGAQLEALVHMVRRARDKVAVHHRSLWY